MQGGVEDVRAKPIVRVGVDEYVAKQARVEGVSGPRYWHISTSGAQEGPGSSPEPIHGVGLRLNTLSLPPGGQDV